MLQKMARAQRSPAPFWWSSEQRRCAPGLCGCPVRLTWQMTPPPAGKRTPSELALQQPNRVLADCANQVGPEMSNLARRTLSSPAFPPFAMPVSTASRQNCGCCRWGDFFFDCPREYWMIWARDEPHPEPISRAFRSIQGAKKRAAFPCHAMMCGAPAVWCAKQRVNRPCLSPAWLQMRTPDGPSA